MKKHFYIIIVILINFSLRADDGNIYLTKSRIYFEDSCDYNKSKSFALKSLTHSKSRKSPLSIIQSYYYLGANCNYLISKRDTAFIYLNQAIEIAKKEHFEIEIPKIKLELANYYIGEGDAETATEILFELIPIFTKNKNQILLAKTYENLAIVFFNVGKIEKSLEFIDKSIQLYKTENSTIKLS